MKFIAVLISFSVSFIFPQFAHSEVQTKTVNYTYGGTTDPTLPMAGPHALVADSNGNIYHYDQNGNMTNGAGLEISYDKRNRISTIKKNGRLVSRFVYGPDGSKAAEILYSCITSPGSPCTSSNIRPTGIRRYFQGGIEERSDPGSIVNRVISLGIDGNRDIEVPLGGSTAAKKFYVYNHLGSVSKVLNSQGRVISSTKYYPYGTVRSGNVPDDSERHGFNGNEYDQETGLYDYGARHYMPEIGRFIMADTVIPDIENPQSWNRYAYVRNNPVNRIDPSGHADEKSSTDNTSQYSEDHPYTLDTVTVTPETAGKTTINWSLVPGWLWSSLLWHAGGETSAKGERGELNYAEAMAKWLWLDLPTAPQETLNDVAFLLGGKKGELAAMALGLVAGGEAGDAEKSVPAAKSVVKRLKVRHLKVFRKAYKKLAEEDQKLIRERLTRVRAGNLGQIRREGRVWSLKWKNSTLRVYFQQTGKNMEHIILLGVSKSKTKAVQQRAIEAANKLWKDLTK
ncbi:MAG: hypothetical protein D6719_06020 [Candidatus Dadabacteria bacterium]|nr:MAG: hypothetical protein D6719_06020 [Candidatus Dadabacteria bacterium]